MGYGIRIGIQIHILSKGQIGENSAHNNITWHHVTVTREMRKKQNRHKSVIVWFTGLSSSGKSTIDHAVEEQLHRHDIFTDYDNSSTEPNCFLGKISCDVYTMTTMEINIRKARENFSEIVNTVAIKGERVILLSKNKAKAAIVSLKHLELLIRS